MDDEEVNFVTYGEPLDEDNPENAKYLHPKVKPQAYEQRALNERGRPMRFHGAFTGGFSAGYFNTVGSKEGFKPQSFSSSRRNRSQNAEQSGSSRPEDFMDDEDLGEFGIAPRHYRTRREYDDHHIFSTLSESLGGKSVIPDASDILKRMLIPSGTSLADRLLRRMGWKSDEIALTLVENEEDASAGAQGVSSTSVSKQNDYAIISFAPKTNTFGLGYSGLEPDIALGRRAPTSRQDPKSESMSALQRREEMHGDQSFNPSTNLIRQGIRGQAFGVGALHSEDADIYAQESLASYDFSIGARGDYDKGDEDGDDDDDGELADLEAARRGRFSDLRRHANRGKGTTIDGWTAPTLPRVSISGIEMDAVSDLLEGFTEPVSSEVCLVLANAEFFVIPKVITIPPGFNPVFHPECLGDCAATPGVMEFTAKDSVFKLLPPEDKRQLEQAVVETRRHKSAVVELPRVPLLRPFTSDSAKQARFEAYQILIRRGFSHEEAYQRCSSAAVELGAETLRFEANVFATLLKNLAPSRSPSDVPVASSLGTQTRETPGAQTTPLTAGILDPEKQRLVASLLKSRFRSVGEMDIAKEMTEAEEVERRKEIEALDMTDPRDNAAVNDSYGVLTRRKLTWHPAALLCKRLNVPNPYPESTFVGCPEDRRFSRHPRRGRRGRRGQDDITSGNFTLFQLLDVNVGVGEEENPEDSEFSDQDEEAQYSAKVEQQQNSALRTSKPQSGTPSGSIFDALFTASEKAVESKRQREDEEALRVIGPAPAPDLPDVTASGEDVEVAPMDLFKSIFASDEESDSEEVQDLEEKEVVIEPTLSLMEVPPSVREQDDCVGRNDDASDLLRSPSAPQRPVTEPPASSLSVHQLFKHLFNPGSDMEAPLYAVSKIAQEKREAKCEREEKTSTADDFYGPALPPHFETTSGSSISSSTVLNDGLSLSSSATEFVERDVNRKSRSGKEHRSQHRHSRHVHKHHKHKKRGGE